MRSAFFTLLLLPLGAVGAVIPPNDPAILHGLSPANWYANGSSYLQTICPGAYLKAGFSGTSLVVTVDVSAMVAAGFPAKEYPWLSWSIDGGAERTVQLAAQSGAIPLAAGLDPSGHRFQLNVRSIDGVNQNRWTGVNSVKITGFIVDDGAGFSPASLAAGGTCLILGDSVPEGAWDQILPDGNSSDFTNYSDDEDATASVAALLGRYLNCEYGQCCHGGIGFTVASGGGVPSVPASYLYQLSGVARSYGHPNYVFIISLGTNDPSLAPAVVTSFLSSLRNTVGPQTKIVEVIPFLGTHGAEITSGFAAFQTAHPGDNSQLIDLGAPAAAIVQASKSDTSYHLHPDMAGHAALAAMIEPWLPPGFLTQPVSQTMPAGATVAFSAQTSQAASYQWTFDGQALSGATAARLVIPNASASTTGTYAVTATNAEGSTASDAATLALAAPGTQPGHLVNLSMLTDIGSGMTMGFVSGGPATAGQQTVLIRATGPALAAAPFNLPGTVPDPVLTLYRGATPVAANAGWGGDQAAIDAADALTGAFPLTDANSHDAAMVTAVSGLNSATVTSASGDSGSALAEVYDATSAATATTPHLINLSGLVPIAPGATLTAGFVIGGDTPLTVLARATGPSLAAAPFNLAGTMPDPMLTLNAVSGATPGIVATDAGWGGDPQIAQVSAEIGAFALSGQTSADSVLLVTLPPGDYTAQVTSATGAGGKALVEIFEVP